MRYLVTGAAGFVGSHLAEALAAGGHDVVGLDCLTDYYDPALKEENARGILLERDDLAGDPLHFSGFDGVFHLAGQPGVRSFGDVFPLYLRRNVLATQRVFEAAAAAGARVVFQTFMNRPPCNASGGHGLDGEVIAFSVGFGKIRWRARIGPTESSPLVAHGRVFVGDWRGNVYALDERTGKIVWSFETGDKVKGAAALSGNRLFVGSYDGHLYSLDAATGKQIWRASSQPRFGHSGQFYSTPAVAYGRVYVGATDGKMYSFGVRSGKLRWSRHTGGYIYASPAIWHGLVLAGSYDETFYAFDAATTTVEGLARPSGDPYALDRVRVSGGLGAFGLAATLRALHA